jgi:hypothetical protein
MKVKVVVEQGKDRRYSACMDYEGDLPFGLAGFGKTAKSAIADFYESYEEEKRMSREEGKTIPALEFDIHYDIGSFLDYYSGILSKSGLEKITGINQKQLFHYSSGIKHPRGVTAKKIQEHIHSFADELKQVQFN